VSSPIIWRLTRTLSLPATLLLAPTRARGQTQLLPTAATTASVTADTLTVFTEMSRSSEVVKSLARGDSVYEREKPVTFTFLGFTHFCRASRAVHPTVQIDELILWTCGSIKAE
jgi:hypothetical protein